MFLEDELWTIHERKLSGCCFKSCLKGPTGRVKGSNEEYLCGMEASDSRAEREVAPQRSHEFQVEGPSRRYPHEKVSASTNLGDKYTLCVSLCVLSLIIICPGVISEDPGTSISN